MRERRSQGLPLDEKESGSYDPGQGQRIEQELGSARSYRLQGWGDVATLLGLAFFALRPILPLEVLGAAGLLLLLLCLRELPGDRLLSRPARATVGALCFYLAVAGPWKVWPAYLLVPILVALAFGAAAGFGRNFRAAAERGRLGRAEWVLIALIALVAAVALILWVHLLEPDLSRPKGLLPDWSMLGLAGAGLAFSIVNALMEEAIWRGLLLRWLGGLMRPAAAVTVQALSFGTAHYAGFPSGFVGAGLATIYGLMVGILALRSQGLIAPIIAHVAADAVIFGLLAGAISF